MMKSIIRLTTCVIRVFKSGDYRCTVIACNRLTRCVVASTSKFDFLYVFNETLHTGIKQMNSITTLIRLLVLVGDFTFVITGKGMSRCVNR